MSMLFYQLSNTLLYLSGLFIQLLLPHINSGEIPSSIVALPADLLSSSASTALHRSPTPLPPLSPIIPLHSPEPHAFSAYLLTHHNILCKAITYPTVPKGKDRIRVCLHTGNAQNGAADVLKLVAGVRGWVKVVKSRHQFPRELSTGAPVNSSEESAWTASKL